MTLNFEQIGVELWELLKEEVEAANRIPYWEESKDTKWLDYKPAYRGLSILLAGEWEGVNLRKKYFDGQRPTKEECTEVLRKTHPYFNAYFEYEWEHYQQCMLGDHYDICCEMGEDLEDEQYLDLYL